ncbi:MAG: hypothetical protein K940chlam7_01064 [Chlamydiae bacterium]|nr:hypothetical protein [Chlamydiota bacterium]
MGTLQRTRNDTDNYFFNAANNWEKRAIISSYNKQFFKSWLQSTAARLPYLVDVIINVVAIPLMLIGALFGAIPAIFTWGKDRSFLDFSLNKLLEKTTHLFISLFGAIISPWAAYKM